MGGPPDRRHAASVGREEAAGRVGRTVAPAGERRHLARRTGDRGIGQARVAARHAVHAGSVARPGRGSLRPAMAAAARGPLAMATPAELGVSIGARGAGGRDPGCRLARSGETDQERHREQQPAGELLRPGWTGAAVHSIRLPGATGAIAHAKIQRNIMIGETSDDVNPPRRSVDFGPIAGRDQPRRRPRRGGEVANELGGRRINADAEARDAPA